MQMTSRRILILALLVLLAAGAAVFHLAEPAAADFSEPVDPRDKKAFTQLKTYDADDLSEFPVEKIVDDFLYIAFPNEITGSVVWTEPVRHVEPVQFGQRVDGLVKWTEPIRIPFQDTAEQSAGYPSLDSQMEKHVRYFGKRLENITGVSFELIDLWPFWSPPNEPVSFQSDTGNLEILYRRIFLVFKYWQQEVGKPLVEFEALEKIDARFTPGVSSQVEGGLITSPSQKGYCYIHKNHEDAMTRALVSECLIRSLGLLNPSRLTRNAFVSRWNYPNADWTGPFYVKVDTKYPELEAELRKKNGAILLREGPSAYDELLLRILYDDALKPGMTRDEVAAVLPGLVKKHRDAMLREDEREP